MTWRGLQNTSQKHIRELNIAVVNLGAPVIAAVQRVVHRVTTGGLTWWLVQAHAVDIAAHGWRRRRPRRTGLARFLVHDRYTEGWQRARVPIFTLNMVAFYNAVQILGGCSFLLQCETMLFTCQQHTSRRDAQPTHNRKVSDPPHTQQHSHGHTEVTHCLNSKRTHSIVDRPFQRKKKTSRETT